MKRFDETRAVLIKDIERCPYVPREPEYAEWLRRDQERINKIIEERKELFRVATVYFEDQEDYRVKDMAKFIIDFFGVD